VLQQQLWPMRLNLLLLLALLITLPLRRPQASRWILLARPLNARCCTISGELIERPLPFAAFRPRQDPLGWA